MWFVILIVAIIIGAIIGGLSSDKGETGAGAMTGAIAGGLGCGYVLLQIFLWGLGICAVIWLFGVLFG